MQKYDIYKYYDSMLRRISKNRVNPYETDDGRILTIAELEKIFYREYDTRVILSGRYVVVTRYSGIGYVRRYDARTGEVIKVYSYDTKNMRDKYVRLAFSNEAILKTFVTLTFSRINDFEGVSNAFRSWVKLVRQDHQDFEFIKVLEKGHKGDKKVHYHLFTSLSIDDPIFKKADTRSDNQYNVVNWEYGFSLASKIKDYIEFRKKAYYIVKCFDVPVFPNKRNMSQSKMLNKPKVFYYDSRFDERKIQSFIKKAELVLVKDYNDPFGSHIESSEYRLPSRNNVIS